jgi:hypothetical protein
MLKVGGLPGNKLGGLLASAHLGVHKLMEENSDLTHAMLRLREQHEHAAVSLLSDDDVYNLHSWCVLRWARSKTA